MCIFDTPVFDRIHIKDDILHRINIHLADRQIFALNNISEDSGLKRSEVIRRAVDEYIDRISYKKFNNQEKRDMGYTGTVGVVQ